MRKVLHISLPTTLQTWLGKQVSQRGFRSQQALLRHLLLLERERTASDPAAGQAADQRSSNGSSSGSGSGSSSGSGSGG